jgi:zinc transport system substrate-binding protein
MQKWKITVLFAIWLILVPFSVVFGGGGREGTSDTAGGSSGADTGAAAGGTVDVFVSILPQKYLAEQVGGGLADVEVLVKPGQSPHAYEPSPSQMVALGKADILFTVGVEFEKALLPKIRSNLPDLEIVAANRGIEYRRMHGDGEPHGHGEDADAHDGEHDTGADSGGAEEHDEHDGHEEHEETGRDPHVWLSPENGKIIARNMRDAFIDIAPAHRSAFEENYRTLAEKIDRVDAELEETLRPLRGGILFVFHPAFGYFAEEYGLEQAAIEVEGHEPGPRELEKIISRAKERGVRVIFVQPQFSKKSAEAVARSIDGAVIPIDPLAYDWLDNLKRIGEKVKQGLSN